LKVGWRGVEQLPHQFDYKQKDLPQLDVCIIYRNAEGASNSDVIFRACREDGQGQTEWFTIGIQCRDICKQLGGTAILDACRKSLPYQAEKAAYHMDHLIFIAPEIDKDSFPTLKIAKRSKVEDGEVDGKIFSIFREETPAEQMHRGSIDQAAYEYFKQSNKVWLSNGRGLISRLWLDFVSNRPLDFNYHDENSVRLYEEDHHFKGRKRDRDEHETAVAPSPKRRVDVNENPHLRP